MIYHLKNVSIAKTLIQMAQRKKWTWHQKMHEKANRISKSKGE